MHGAVLHPGRALPEVAPDVDRHIPGEAGLIRLRRWHLLHYEAYPHVRLDVVRIDDPAYDPSLKTIVHALRDRMESQSVTRWSFEACI